MTEEEHEAFIEFCEAEGFDPDDPTVVAAWTEQVKAHAEEAAVDSYEARMDAKRAEMEDRGVW